MHLDYVPNSLSCPLTILPCGHGLGQNFGNTVVSISEQQGILLLRKIYDKIVEEK